MLSQILSDLPQDSFDKCSLRIIQDCANRLGEYGPERIEYVVWHCTSGCGLETLT